MALKPVPVALLLIALAKQLPKVPRKSLPRFRLHGFVPDTLTPPVVLVNRVTRPRLFRKLEVQLSPVTLLTVPLPPAQLRALRATRPTTVLL